jgi:ribosomal protein S1
MKKLIALVLVVVLAMCVLTGCNKQLFDATYSFERAIIYLPNGEVIEGEVTSWTDYEDGDQIQVTINGKTYLVHSSNIVLISE